MSPPFQTLSIYLLVGLATTAVAESRSEPAANSNGTKSDATQRVPTQPEAEQLFVRRIQPLFAEKCLACHGNDEKKIKGGLDMRTLAATLKGGESERPGFVPGKPDQSPLYLASLRTHDDWEPMPPKDADKLYAEQIGWIKEWIAGGAPWPDAARVKEVTKANAEKWAAEDGVLVKTSGGLAGDWTNRRYKPEGLWGYQPVKKPAVEKSGSAAIDELIGSKLPEDVKPAPPADALTFIRRATFDLTGLPPTPEEVAAFEQDSIRNSQAAIRSLVDRLLASPHYGERMAQHWLDVTRYADSSGFANDYERGNAWRYRDYVVRSFNADKPYDQFVREQIAGDEIDPNNPEMVIATGFLRMGPWELTGMEVPKIARQRFLDDITNSVGETFLAHSLQCARCHDHKFDPVPTGDYYAIQAVFGTTQLVERPAAFLPGENKEGFDERKYIEMRRAEHQAMLRKLDAVMLASAQKWFTDQGKDPAKWNAAVEAARKISVADPNKKFNQLKGNKRREFSDVFTGARNLLMRDGVPEGDFPPKLVGLTPEQFGMERVARKGLERLKWELDRYEPYALAVYDGRTPEVKAVTAPMRMPANRMAEGELEETCIHPGGDPFAEGAKVKPGVLSAVLSFNPPCDVAIPGSVEGRRKAFASWVAHKDNPLAIRTIANRLWMWHFNQPIAGNPNNFGSTGRKPTNPELLDWLAATLVEQGWSIKAMHRVIMNSEAYRRASVTEVLSKTGEASAKQSEHSALSTEHFASFLPRRLTAEELRDAALAATGELNRTLGGVPNRPEINLEAALQPRQVMGTFANAWVPNPKPEQRNRRSIYALKLRGLTDPMLEVFNAPSPDFSCERREASTVTPQVFSLFNGKASQSRALALAARALRETKANDDEAALMRCFALTYGRAPNTDELTACLAHWRDMQTVHSKTTIALTRPPLDVRRDAVEENTGEKFSFDEKLHANAEFVPDAQPAEFDVRTRALADVCLALFNSNEFVYVY